ncbi:Acetamidase/Formamidase family protein [Zea mays]|uniref:Acetamidase/Formamidase family protein n=1 Tax=Zea mays TaxID=4577 RepID=A0A1D6FKN5_MAIZE|nr:Acetamidase/Formamidase family protein [Zea mays]
MASMLEKIDEMLLLAVYKKVCTSLGASRRRWAPKPFVARSFKPPTTYSKPTPPRVMIGPVSSLSEPSPGPPSPSSSPSPAASSRKAIWYFEGIYAYSPQIPGVRFPGLTHPGIVGTAPSAKLLNIQEGTAGWHKVANEAARTIPGRENGGNCDIKNLSRGSKVYLPVFVEGANLSTGDMHFSQGDGEVSFCGAIEMSGFLELKFDMPRAYYHSRFEEESQDSAGVVLLLIQLPYWQ